MILFKGIDNLLFNYSVINLLIVVRNNYISLLNCIDISYFIAPLLLIFVINSISVFLIFVINSICQVTEYSLFDGYI